MTNEAQTLRSNETVTTLLNRRSIRKFKPTPIDEETVTTLETVAQRAASSQYLNDWSAIRVKDQGLKDALAKVGKQPYIAEAPLLYVFVADEHRNAAIATLKGVDVHSDDFTLTSSYRLTQAHNDAVLALSAMETAAYSFGLGCVILGSILNDPAKVVELLHLPEFTYPVLGLAVGEPDQSPMLKPRMKRTAQFFDNAYPATDEPLTRDLDEFDGVVHQYYDLRHADRPVDAFSVQIVENGTDRDVFARAIKPIAERQGFRFDR